MKKIENTIIIGLGNVGALYDKNLKHHVTTHLKSLEILKEKLILLLLINFFFVLFVSIT